MHVLRRTIANWKLKYKLVAIVAIAVGIVATASIVGLRFVVTRYDSLLYTAMADSLSLHIREIESDLKSVENASSFIIADQAFQDNLELLLEGELHYEENVAIRSIYQALHKYAAQNKYITAICILQNGREAFTMFTNPAERRSDSYDAISERARAAGGQTVWGRDGGAGGGILCARAIRKAKNLSLEELGVLIIHVDLNRIVAETGRGSGGMEPPAIAILAEDGPVYQNGDIQWDDLSASAPYSILDMAGERQFVIRRPAGSHGWTYFSYAPYNSIFESILFSQVLFVVAVALSILLAVLIANLMTRSLIRHFERLGRKMESFRAGNLEPIDVAYDYSRRRDELASIHRLFDDMLHDIADLIEDNYVKQLLIKDAQIKTLEQQINPHFLYNTLDSIYWRANAAGQEEISRMVQSLANLLRLSINERSDTIPLKREMALVDNYIRIQRMRHEDRLEYSAEIDPALLELSVPKMSIQPLVENAIKYSLEEVTEPCRIRVCARSDRDTANICVSNSGSYIDENILERIERSEIRPRGQGIGLSNIDSRIKLLFGQRYGLSFYNLDGDATVVITLPLAAAREG